MNSTPILSAWLNLLGLLAVEVALVAGVTTLLQRWINWAAWRRTIWQGCVVAVLLLVVIELSGLGREFAGWIVAGSGAVEAKVARSSAAKAGEPEEALSPRLTTEFRGRVAAQVARSRQRETLPSPTSRKSAVGSVTESHPTGNAAESARWPEKSPGHDFVSDSMAILWLGIVWSTGAVVVLSRACAVRLLCVVFRWRRRFAADPELARRVRALAIRLRVRRRIHFVEAARLATPIAFGILRPTVGLPNDFSKRFNGAQLETMLAHELAHLAARDPFWYLLADLAAAVLWWHPLVWWSRRQLHSASEVAADEASLLIANGPSVLAECLVEFGTRLTRQRASAWMGIDGAGFRSGLGRRVERLVRLQGQAWNPPARLRAALAKAAGSVVLVASTLLCTAWVGPQTFNKGESMKTMKETWKRSLTAFALLTTLGTGDNAALAANGADRPGGKPAKPAETASKSESEKPPVSSPDKSSPAEKMVTKVYRLKYSDPADMVAAVKPALSDQSRIVPDSRTRQIVVVGSETELLEVASLIEKLDKQPNGTEQDKSSAPGAPSAEYYNRLMMERYGLIPKGSVQAANSATTVAPSELMRQRYGMPAVKRDKGRVESKLEEIVLNEVMFDSLPLPQVVQYLTEEAAKRDPDKAGINFLINPNVAIPAVTPVIDPTTGQPLPAPAPEPLDMNSVIVRINPPLKNVRLKDALDAIVKVADRPVQYSVEAYGVVISQNAEASQHASTQLQPGEATLLQVRTFKVDTNIFLAGLESAFGISLGAGSAADGLDAEKIRIKLRQAEKDVERIAKNVEAGVVATDELEKAKLARDLLALDLKQVESGRGKPAGERTSQARSVQNALRALLTQLGIKMDVPNKAVFYNELTGIVMVRATLEELEIVRAAIETLGGSAAEAAASQDSTNDRDASFYNSEMRRRYGLPTEK